MCFDKAKDYLTADNYDTYQLFTKKYDECINPLLDAPVGESEEKWYIDSITRNKDEV